MHNVAAYDGALVNLEPRTISSANALLYARQNERPQCGSSGKGQAYDLGLHVFALFLILFLSIFACAFPIAAKKIPSLPVPRRALFLSRHFGTGVLLATAFVHLLPTAFMSLTDPCLSPFWNQGYPAMAGFIAMVSMFVVVGIEMFFATKGAGHAHESDYTTVPHEVDAATANRALPSPSRPGHRRFRSNLGIDDEYADEVSNAGVSSMNGSHINLISPTTKTSMGDGAKDEDSDLELEDYELPEDIEGTIERRPNGSTHGSQSEQTRAPHPHQGGLTDYQKQQRALLQCMLLEAGILFHSIFIGMAVSVATGTAFIVLLIAISFHQTFEGLALGSRIAGITAFPKGSIKPWLMALAYGATTPIGQAIGLIVHNLYDPRSETGLLMVGMMNAISSGLLLFAGLVELMAEDFLSEKSYETLRGKHRIEASAAVVAGSMLMALVGAWA
ncbi:Zinc/iron permease [Myriangium duriaei CBS 260.36]|uniref:Zinc/iron permease n=1 Tax=Myriangium duriaei CBS 260.36 TaxID=1168546 RepID=A0A9P4J891_9PEZI|nr:Zinc/iron permease [Myriangium duriaei CBS 260.36]